MKKELEGELISLAHSILKSNQNNVHELKLKAGLLYEKLCVLSFAEHHFAGKQPSIGKAEFVSAFEEELKKNNATPIPVDVPINQASTEQVHTEKPAPTEEPEIKTTPPVEPIHTSAPIVNENKEEKASPQEAYPSPKEAEHTPPEMNDEQPAIAEEDFGVHLDDLPLFEPISYTPPSTNEETYVAKEEENPLESTSSTEKNSPTKAEASLPQRTMDLFSQDKKSLNQQLKSELKIGLNDRLAFTKKLFDGDVEAYNKVLAKLQEFDDFVEAQSYLYQHVRPAYSWDKHEQVEQRFLDIIEGKLS